jgi:Cu/Ag efflux protein CusF
MRNARIAATTIFFLSLAGLACAQEAMKGKVASVDARSGKIDIVVKSVSAEGPPTPTEFKAQRGLVFNSLKPGDPVSFTVENVGGVLTIETIAKE